VYAPRGLTCRVTGREAILLAAQPGMQSDAWYEVNWEEEEIGTSYLLTSKVLMNYLIDTCNVPTAALRLGPPYS